MKKKEEKKNCLMTYHFLSMCLFSDSLKMIENMWKEFFIFQYRLKFSPSFAYSDLPISILWTMTKDSPPICIVEGKEERRQPEKMVRGKCRGNTLNVC